MSYPRAVFQPSAVAEYLAGAGLKGMAVEPQSASAAYVKASLALFGEFSHDKAGA